MAEHSCENCPVRAKYDNQRRYMRSLDEDKRELLIQKYLLKKS